MQVKPYNVFNHQNETTPKYQKDLIINYKANSARKRIYDLGRRKGAIVSFRRVML
jgi:hypothetical protein